VTGKRIRASLPQGKGLSINFYGAQQAPLEVSPKKRSKKEKGSPMPPS
jgi:hypothetical protein